MNKDQPVAGSWPAIDEQTLRQFDEEALKRCCGDAALWFHHRALLEGEFCIKRKGEAVWKGWMLVKNLSQFKATELSVVEGWRKYVANMLGIPRTQQRNPTAINRASIINACRTARNDQQVVEILKQRADSIRVLAAGGDVHFFRSFGRLLSPLRHSASKAHDYANAMLNYWLTSYLWLMPERTASDCLATGLGKKLNSVNAIYKELERFKKAKKAYRLRPHNPSLVNHIAPNGTLILTPSGRLLLRTPTSAT